MSQMDNPYADPSAAPASTSKLAITSLICSLVFCCPLTTLLGPLLGLISLAKIGSNPLLKGRGLALAAIVLGLGFTALQGFGVYKFVSPMIALMNAGPRDALAAGFAGDIAGFKGAFHGAGATASDAEATAFIAELRSRYGEFQTAQIVPGVQPQFGQTVFTLPYSAVFDGGTVTAETEVIMGDEVTGQFVMKIGSIAITDADKGDLVYPPSP